LIKISIILAKSRSSGAKKTILEIPRRKLGEFTRKTGFFGKNKSRDLTLRYSIKNEVLRLCEGELLKKGVKKEAFLVKTPADISQFSEKRGFYRQKSTKSQKSAENMMKKCQKRAKNTILGLFESRFCSKGGFLLGFGPSCFFNLFLGKTP
jgi:hypothetical protein